MAHMIEEVNGEAQMAFVGDRKAIWHRLGTELPVGVTPAEMQKAAGLDWTVEKKKLIIDGVGELNEKRALVRSSDNKVLDVVGRDWQPVQNDTAFEFFNEFCEAGNMQMSTAGSLDGGKRVWALAKVAEDFTVFGDDKVESYLLFSNPHKFGACVDVRFTPIRVVCNNTLTLSLNTNSSNFAKVNHRTEFDPEAVKQVLGLASKQMNEYKETAEFLGSKQVTDEQFKRFLDKVFGESKVEDKLSRTGQMAYEAFETQPGAEFARGSWWQAFNAATYVIDHKVGRNDSNRLNSAWFGINRTKKIKAVETALEMAA